MGRRSMRSFAFEFRLALFAERFDALVRILRDKDAADRLALDGQPKVEWGAVSLGDRDLGVADGDAGPGGELGRVFDRAGAARGSVGKKAVHQTQLLGLGRIHRRRVGHEVAALRAAPEARRALSPA